jgi:hypothetical protein
MKTFVYIAIIAGIICCAFSIAFAVTVSGLYAPMGGTVAIAVTLATIGIIFGGTALLQAVK